MLYLERGFVPFLSMVLKLIEGIEVVFVHAHPDQRAQLLFILRDFRDRRRKLQARLKGELTLLIHIHHLRLIIVSKLAKFAVRGQIRDGLLELRAPWLVWTPVRFAVLQKGHFVQEPVAALLDGLVDSGLAALAV